MDLLTEALARMGRMIQPVAEPARDALKAAPDHIKLLVAKLEPISLSSWQDQATKPQEKEEEFAEAAHFAMDDETPLRLSQVEGSFSFDQPAVLDLQEAEPRSEGTVFRPWRWPRPRSTKHQSSRVAEQKVPRQEYEVGQDMTIGANDSQVIGNQGPSLLE